MSWLLVEGRSLILGALLVLILPLPWLAAGVLAAAWHEICHALAVKAAGAKVLSLRVGLWGMRMETSPLEKIPGALCALAGPAGSLTLLLLRPWMPQLAAWGLLQGTFNLLPIFPLDGGRALGLLAPRVSAWAERFAILALAILALYGAIQWGTGMYPMLAVAGLALGRKKPCKSRHLRVQ